MRTSAGFLEFDVPLDINNHHNKFILHNTLPTTFSTDISMYIGSTIYFGYTSFTDNPCTLR